MARDVEFTIKGSTDIPPPVSRWTSSDDDLIEFAWLIIAGAMNVGDPPVDPVPGWHDAARQWRDLYHEYLGRGK